MGAGYVSATSEVVVVSADRALALPSTRPSVWFFPDLRSLAQVYLAKRGINLPTYLGSVRCLWLRDLPTYSDPYLSRREWLPTYLLVLSRVHHVGYVCF